jgi:hypothetical protein
MKKWMYVIFPGSLLALFLVFFLSHKKDMEEREAARAVALQAQLDETAKTKKINEEKAHVDAMKRAEDRAKEEADKAAKKAADLAAKDKAVEDATKNALVEGDKSAQEAARLEIDLDRLHKQKTQLSREAFELAQAVELAKVARRNAELDQQHTVEMVARKAAEGVLARLPPPPALPPKP